MFGLHSLSFKASNDVSQPNFLMLGCIKLSSCPFLPFHILLFQAKLYLCAFIYIHCLSKMCSLSSLLAGILLVVLGWFQVPFLPPLLPMLEVVSVALGYWWHFIQHKGVVPYRLLLPCRIALTPLLHLTF